MRRNTNGSGFTLIELLIVVAIIGIIAAIAIPNLLNAIQRGKQKRTMADIRSVGTANESYSIDNNQYVDEADLAAAAPFLEPTYIKKLPQKDGWSTQLGYSSTAAEYVITSYGKDKTIAGGGAVAPNGGTTDFRDDIMFDTGGFTEFPEGSQT